MHYSISHAYNTEKRKRKNDDFSPLRDHHRWWIAVYKGKSSSKLLSKLIG